MILFQLDADSDDILDIVLDQDGLERLRDVLDQIERSQGHDHLMVPSWAGSDLDESSRDGGRLIKKVNIGLLKERTD